MIFEGDKKMNSLLLSMCFLSITFNQVEVKEFCMFKCNYVQMNDQVWQPVERANNAGNSSIKTIYFIVERNSPLGICEMRYAKKEEIQTWKNSGSPSRKWIRRKNRGES